MAGKFLFNYLLIINIVSLTSAGNSQCPGTWESPKPVVCYYERTIPVNELNFCNCSHLIFANGVNLGENMSLELAPGVIEDQSAFEDTSLRLIFSVTTKADVTAAILKTEANKRQFLQSVVDILTQTNFSGIELDFQFKNEDGLSRQALVSFTKELKTVFDHHRIKREGYSVFENQNDDITTSKYTPDKTNLRPKKLRKKIARVPRSGNFDSYDEDYFDDEPNNNLLLLRLSIKPEILAKKYDLKALSKFVDYFMVPTHMIIDDSESDVTFHHARLMGLSDMLNMDSIIDLLTGLGAPKSKLIVSLPAEALQFDLKDEEDTIVRSKTSGPPRKISQIQLHSLFSRGEWTVERDEDLTAPYAFKKKSWIAFEDEISANIKGKYIILRELAGAAVYPIDADAPCAKCNDITFKTGGRFVANLHNAFTKLSRKSRALVLDSLQTEIHDSATFYSHEAGVKLSEYRIVRVVDHSGAVHVIRKNTKTEFECSRQGYFSHPLGCNKFYRCVKFNQYTDDFTVFEYDCPKGLAFDERWEVCVWPGALPHGAPCSGSSEIAPVPRAHYECPNVEGYYADPENCRWFFACLDHARDGITPLTAYEFRCPFGLVFDEQKLVCDWPWLVGGCGARGLSGYVVNKVAGITSDHLGGLLLSERPAFASVPDYEVSGGRIVQKGGVVLGSTVGLNLQPPYEGVAEGRDHLSLAVHDVNSPLSVNDKGLYNKNSDISLFSTTGSPITIDDRGSSHRSSGISLGSVKTTPTGPIIVQNLEPHHSIPTISNQVFFKGSVSPSSEGESVLVEDEESHHKSSGVSWFSTTPSSLNIDDASSHRKSGFSIVSVTPTPVALDQPALTESNAYNYPKPSVKFELPQKYAEIGYSYPKPAVKFELPQTNAYLPPKPEIIKNPAPSLKILNKPIVVEQQYQYPPVFQQGILKDSHVSNIQIVTPRPTFQHIIGYQQTVTPKPSVVYEEHHFVTQKIKPTVIEHEPVLYEHVTPNPILYNFKQTRPTLKQVVVKQRPVIASHPAVYHQKSINPKPILYQYNTQRKPIFYQSQLVTPKPIFQEILPIQPVINQEIVTGQPVVTAKPVIYQQEVVSPKPVIYEQQIINPKPVIYQQKVVTPKPVVYQQQVINPKPVIYQQEVVTPKPVVYQQQVINPKPVIYQQEVVTPKPVVYQQQVINPKPIIYQQEVVTPKPVIYQQQVVTAKPVIYQQEVVTPKPVVYQQQVVTAKPVTYQQEVVTPKPVVYQQQVVTAKPVTYQQEVVTPKPVVYQQQVINPKPVVYQQEVVTPKPVIYQQQVVTAKPVIYQQEVVTPKPVIYQQQVVTAKPVIYQQEVVTPKPVVYQQQVINPKPTIYQQVVTPKPVVYQQQVINPKPVIYQQKFVTPKPVIYQQQVFNPKPVIYQQEVVTPKPVIYQQQVINPKPVIYQQEVVTPKPVVYQQQVINPKPVIYQQEVVTSKPVVYQQQVINPKPVIYQQEVVTPKPVVYQQQVINPKPVIYHQEVVTPKPVIYQQQVVTAKPVIYQQEVVTPKPVIYQQQVNNPKPTFYQQFVTTKPVFQEIINPKPLVYQQQIITPKPIIYQQEVVTREPIAYQQKVIAKPVVYQQDFITRKPVVIRKKPVIYEQESIVANIFPQENKVTRRPIVVQEKPVFYTQEISIPKSIKYSTIVNPVPITVKPTTTIHEQKIFTPSEYQDVYPYEQEGIEPKIEILRLTTPKVTIKPTYQEIVTQQPFSLSKELKVKTTTRVRPPSKAVYSEVFDSVYPASGYLPPISTERITIKNENIRIAPPSREYLATTPKKSQRKGKTTIVSIGQVDKTEVDDKNLEGVLESAKSGPLSDKFVTKIIKGDDKGTIKVGKEPEVSTVGYEITSVKNGRTMTEKPADTADLSLATLDLKNLKIKKDKKTIIVVSQVSDANPILIGKLAGQCSCQSNSVDLKKERRKPVRKNERPQYSANKDEENGGDSPEYSLRGKADRHNPNENSNIPEYLERQKDGRRKFLDSEDDGDRDSLGKGEAPYVDPNSSENEDGYAPEIQSRDFPENQGEFYSRKNPGYERLDPLGSPKYKNEDRPENENSRFLDDENKNPLKEDIVYVNPLSSSNKHRGYPQTSENKDSPNTPNLRRGKSGRFGGFIDQRVTTDAVNDPYSSTTLVPDVSPSILVPIAPKPRRIPSRSKNVLIKPTVSSDLLTPIPAEKIAQEKPGAAFDRYGPGGWRSADETLQGSVDCKRPGLFRHPKYCNKFYSCNYDPWKKRYTLHVFNCPVHLAYDSNLGACNWPSKGPACADDNLLV